MENEEQNDFRLEGTGFAYTLSLINGKYKMPILYCLSKREVVRYNEMKRYLGKVTFKTLTDSLKALEEDGLVSRKEYPQVPPKVEYSLTEKGRSLIPMLTALCTWGEEHRELKLIVIYIKIQAGANIESCPAYTFLKNRGVFTAPSLSYTFIICA